MPNVSGFVYYDDTNLLTPGIGIANVPVVLYSPSSAIGSVALTNAAGVFLFNNVPNGSYQVIEAWGAPGGVPTPANFALASSMPVPPPEAEPPISASPVAPPALADRFGAVTPNLLNVTVSGGDITNLTFFDVPTGDKALNFSGVNFIGPNLITAVDNGTWGQYPPGTPGSTIPATDPYPGVSPGFTYVNNPIPADGSFIVTNSSVAWTTPSNVWWGTADHTTGLETGRFMMINGANPGAIIFTQNVTVIPDMNYVLSAWIMNLIDNFNPIYQPPRLGLQVLDSQGNVLISQMVNPVQAQNLPVWYQNGFLFNSGANSTLTIQIISQGAAAIGNDFAIDDLSLYPVDFVDLLIQDKSINPNLLYTTDGVGTSTVTVTVTNPSANPVTGVQLQDTLNPRIVFVPGSILVDGSAVGYETDDPGVGFSIGTLASGQTKTVQFQVTSTAGSGVTIPNTANISYDAVISGTGDVIRVSFPTNTANLDIVVNKAKVEITKNVDKPYANVGDVLTYKLTLTNTGNVPATNVVITDPVPNGTTYINGTLLGANGTPPNLVLASPLAPGASTTVTYQVLVGSTIPSPNPVGTPAGVSYSFTIDPAIPNGGSGAATSEIPQTLISSAIISIVKTNNKPFADVGDTITYTISITNSGNAAANNVVLTDALPAGVTFVTGSLVNASGTPPVLKLNASVPAGGSVAVSYQVKVGAVVPNPNPVENSTSAAFTYTVDPAKPNGASGTSYSNTVDTQVNTARLVMQKSADKTVAYVGDVITYTLVITNSGNVNADNVAINDAIPVGTALVPGSLTVNVPFTGTLPAITLTNPVTPGQVVTVSFQLSVTDIPIPNPIVNTATVGYAYTVDPAQPDAVTAAAQSNAVPTLIFRYDYGQQISDLIESVSQEQAALAAIANAEGAKVQAAVAMGDITQQELLCINKSVADMLDSLAILEAVLKQKLNLVKCQIDGSIC